MLDIFGIGGDDVVEDVDVDGGGFVVAKEVSVPIGEVGELVGP